MNIVHSKGTIKLVKLHYIDQLMNKYEGQYTGKIILLENKSIYDAQVNELDRLIRKEIHKTKEEERWKKSDKLNTVYNNFIKELDKKTNDLDKKLEEFKGYE